MVPFKTCTLDCVYCECGQTTELTTERKEYISADLICAELELFLKDSPKLDYVTFAGSGEPTLNSGLGKCIDFVKKNFPDYKIALLTNATLLTDPTVRYEILPCDLVVPSLDAVSSESFSKVNRPQANLRNKDIIDGIISFASSFKGALWLELFIVPGVNDNPEELSLLKQMILRIAPTRVQLNTLDRPGTEGWVAPADYEILQQIAKALLPLPVEIVSRTSIKISYTEQSAGSIFEFIRRRPSTIEELAAHTGTTINQVHDILASLIDQKKVYSKTSAKKLFYCASI